MRHGDESTSETNTASLKNDSYYCEPLSGSQSYLSSLIALQRNAEKLSLIGSNERISAIRELTGLLENSLMRILLIDERATRFAKEHVEVNQIFKGTGIFACDENHPAVVELAKDFPGFVSRGESEKADETISGNAFEIVIIHQGIIDKILEDHTQAGVDKFLRGLMKYFRYVVVTTGRGTPANIPDIARVLPFSVVESTLFKRYPEKVLLVDTIMNILPGKEIN